MKKVSIALALSILFSACATPTVVQRTKVGDGALSCDQLNKEIAEADKFEADARKERTVTGKNVAAAIFFWPALLGTYSNTEEAITAAKERRSNLVVLHNKKNCSA